MHYQRDRSLLNSREELGKRAQSVERSHAHFMHFMNIISSWLRKRIEQVHNCANIRG